MDWATITSKRSMRLCVIRWRSTVRQHEDVAMAQGKPELIQRVEQFERARLEREPRLRDHPEMTDPRLLELIDRERLAEMGEEEGSHGKPTVRLKTSMATSCPPSAAARWIASW